MSDKTSHKMPHWSQDSASVAKTSTFREKPSYFEHYHSGAERSAYVILALIVLLVSGSWAVYHYQYESLPFPLDAYQAGKEGFSEVSAMDHAKYLTNLGPHSVGSVALDLAVQYVFAASEKVKTTAHGEVDVQVDLFHADIGANRLVGGSKKGKTLIYSNLTHVVVRILPKNLPEAEENVILVSSHIDTVFSGEGAGDDTSCVAVMLELARGISQWAHGFKNGVIFLFNTGEENGLNGAHSFITQHPWRNTIKFVVDLEAIGVGGKSSIFQSGTSPWAIETFARVAKYPSGQIVVQDGFSSGFISSSTDLQVYKELAGPTGLDSAYTDTTAVYHTRNDKLEFLKPGSLQHLGDNMLAFLIQAGSESLHRHEEAAKAGGNGPEQTVYFDVLGMYMVVCRQHLASMIYNSVIALSLLIWTTYLLMGGYPVAITFGLSCLKIILMLIFSISLSVLVAFILPHICSSPVPYIANLWLVAGLFGAPAILGALAGQHIGFLLLQKHLQHNFPKRAPGLSPNTQENLIKWEAERWLFKGGLIQWLVLLIVGNFYKVGSTYLALVWLVSPAFAYGLMEVALSPVRLPKMLKSATLVLSLFVPVLISAGPILRLVESLTGNLPRFDRNPGGSSEWLGSVIIAVYIAASVCLTLVYLLSYIHNSGAKRLIIISLCALLSLTLDAVSTGTLPAFTEDIARTVNVVHVVETTGRYGENEDISSYISLFSTTPGELTKETENLRDEEFSCGRNKSIDFVSFTVKYGCLSSKDGAHGWGESDVPALHVESDSAAAIRQTRVFIDTKNSTRWALAINTEEISDFTFEANLEEVVPARERTDVDGWHIIQFAGGKDSPTKFHLNLLWLRNATDLSENGYEKEGLPLLLKLRTDVDRVTPTVARVLEKLPPWCAIYGKSSSPYTLAFLTSLPVHF